MLPYACAYQNAVSIKVTQGLVKMQILISGDQDPTFLASSLLMLKLMVCGLSFEYEDFTAQEKGHGLG